MNKARIRSIVQRLRSYKEVLLSLFLFGIAADIFLFKLDSDIRKIFLILLGLLIIRLYNLKNSVTFIFALIMTVCLGILYLVARFSVFTDKTAVWLFLLLVVGLVQQFFDMRFSKK